jgi:hypothetical protein
MYVKAVEIAGDGLGSFRRDCRAFYYYRLYTPHISLFYPLRNGPQALQRIDKRYYRNPPQMRPFSP